MEHTRLNNKGYKKEMESRDMMRMEFLDKNFQDPNKLILPFARGGEMTREKYSR